MAFNLDRNKILDACLAVVARHGFRKASLADIARPLGVAKTALYHHFPGGKQELMNALIQREEDLILLEMREAINKDEQPIKKIRNIILAKLNHFHRLRELFDVIIEVGEEINNVYCNHKDTFHSAEVEMILSILKEGQQANLIRQTNIERLAYSIQIVLHHFELPLVFNKMVEIEKEVDELLDVLFYGIAARQN